MLTDWKTDRDALIQETMAFAARVRKDASTLDWSDLNRAANDRTQPPPAPGTTLEIERAAIKQRVANFKALQQRLIHEREAFANTALQQIRHRASGTMGHSQMLGAIAAS
jgi:hypothetical protein